MISFTYIRTDKVKGIGEIIMAATTDDLRRNQNYRRLNNIKVLVHWSRSRHVMVLDLYSRCLRSMI